MTRAATAEPLRLWPGVVIVAVQLIALYVPAYLAPATPAMFFGMMGSFLIGAPLLLLWWLFFSRARWSDRLAGFALLVVVHVAALLLAHPSAKFVTLVPGVPWLCAAFVASLFFARRSVTLVFVLVASLGWTLVRTDGVTGTMDADYAWRFSATSEERFLASDSSTLPSLETIVGGTAPEAAERVAWPGFRGPDRDNVLGGIAIDTDWSQNPPKEIWRRPVGPGWSSFALVGDRLCTQEQRDEDEVVVCYDARTGEPIWLHAYPARFWEALGGAGPRATPTYHEGHLYTLGATGVLNRIDAKTGKPSWNRNIAEDTGAPVPDWGFASSPLIVEDSVIVHAAGAPDGRAVVAYDTTTGEPRWFGQAPGASYSSPHSVTIDGRRQIVMITGDGVFGLGPATGELLWKHDWPMGGGGSRIVQPAIVDGGNGLLIGTSFGMGTRKITVTSDGAGDWNVGEGWTSQGLKPYFNDLVVHRGVAFGFDGHILAAIEIDTGERAWKGGRYGNGQVLLLPDQDLLLVLSETGELALVRASSERFEEVARMQVLEGKTWNHPVVADGVLYVRNAEEAAAYRLPVETSEALPAVGVLIHHRIADYDAWKVVFDDHAPAREEASCLGHYLKRGVDDPDVVYIYCLATDADRLQAFLDSEDLAAAMKSAGVVGEPTITVMKPVFRDLVSEQKLPGIIVMHQVDDYETWRAVYDDFEPFRRESGIVGHAVTRELGDPNRVIVYHQANELSALRSFVDSAELGDAMESAGVVGDPEIHFIRVVDFADY